MTNESCTVGIYYFSGTGNTEIVARLLGEEFKKKGCTVDITRIEDVLNNTVRQEMEKYALVGMGYPVHALNAPKIFFDFIEQLPFMQKKVFTFRCSADPFMKGGTTTMVRKRLHKKGYTVFYERLFVMPSNVLVGYADELIKQLYNAAVNKTGTMCEEVLSGKEFLQENDLLSQIIVRMFSGMEQAGAPLFGKDLTVSDSCTLCNQCVKNCPTNNISRINDTITFGWNCILCMRCVYSCPENAISPRLFRFFVLREGFNVQEVINDPAIKGDFVTTETKGYFKRFCDYLKQ